MFPNDLDPFWMTLPFSDTGSSICLGAMEASEPEPAPDATERPKSKFVSRCLAILGRKPRTLSGPRA